MDRPRGARTAIVPDREPFSAPVTAGLRETGGHSNPTHGPAPAPGPGAAPEVKNMARSKSSARWLREHFDDPYVKAARVDGYRSRATYKLKEIDEKDRLLKPGMTVVDLGASPGGWAQYARQKVGKKGTVIAMDILPMDPIEGVDFIQGDFHDEQTLQALLSMLAGRQVDLVICDIAPNKSGVDAVDQPRAMLLAELSADFALQALRPGGDLLLKAFQGQGFEDLLRLLRQNFTRVNTRKPQASRARSREHYLLARNYGLV